MLDAFALSRVSPLTFRSCAAALASACTLLGAAPAFGQSLEDQPDETPRTGLLIAGAATFGPSYLFSVIAAGGDSADNQRPWLYVPIAGPFVYLARRERCPGHPPSECVDDFVTPMTFGLFGAAQVVGTALFASGYVFPKRREAPRAAGNPAWLSLKSVEPGLVGPSGMGVWATGVLF